MKSPPTSSRNLADSHYFWLTPASFSRHGRFLGLLQLLCPHTNTHTPSLPPNSPYLYPCSHHSLVSPEPRLCAALRPVNDLPS
jgi:hypothetical protein